MPTTITSPETHRHHRRRHYLTRNQRKLLLFLLKCIIMLIIFSLFLFFLGFAAIVLFHFLIMSNTFNRRKPAAADSPPLILLPDVIYKASDFETASDCAICLDSFVEGDTCRDLPTCGHFFHARCVDRWIGRRPTCPVCRTRVELDPVGLTGSGGVDRWKGLWGDI